MLRPTGAAVPGVILHQAAEVSEAAALEAEVSEALAAAVPAAAAQAVAGNIPLFSFPVGA